MSEETSLNRTCSTCVIEKPAATEFFAARERGLRAQCRVCSLKREKLRRKRPEVRQRIQEAQARYNSRPDVVEQRKSYLDGYRRTGRLAAVNAARKERTTESDREKIRRYAREYYAGMTDEQKERKRERQLKRQAERRANDPRVRLRQAVSTMIGTGLRKRGGSKSESWESILGYSIEDLKRHLERQFVRDMSWGNYGKWHVDHIVPVASFKWQTTDDEDFRACWALTNLRPLWANENRSKNGKRLHLI